MPDCYDSWKREYVSCGSHMAVYIAVGIVVPVIIGIIAASIAGYRRYKLNRYRREQQQIGMNTIVPIDNSDEQQQAAYNYSFPPQYSAVVSGLTDKPPSYEQTVEQLSGTHPTSDSTAAILPVTTTTSEWKPPSRNEP